MNPSLANEHPPTKCRDPLAHKKGPAYREAVFVSSSERSGGGLSLLRTDDRIHIDLTACTATLIDEPELEQRRQETLTPKLENATPWQEIYRNTVGQLNEGAVMELATKYRDVCEQCPRHNH